MKFKYCTKIISVVPTPYKYVRDAEIGRTQNRYLHNVYAHKMHTVVLRSARSEKKGSNFL